MYVHVHIIGMIPAFCDNGVLNAVCGMIVCGDSIIISLLVSLQHYMYM